MPDRNGVQELLAALSEPFDPGVVEWRVTNTSGKRGQVVAYADQRAYTDRLNDLFTPLGWTRKYAVQTVQNFEVPRKGDGKNTIITAKVMAEFSRLSRFAPTTDEKLAEPLSPRELEILRLVATGSSNREIADVLIIAEGTVKNHLTNILGKLNVKDRMQAVLKAKEYGLI